VRAPHLYRSLRCFCLGTFSLLHHELERGGAELPFAFEEHTSPGRPALYEHRPLVHQFVEARTERIARLRDTRTALDDLAAEPAAGIFARAHAGGAAPAAEALLDTVLVPLVTAVAEACAGFDWNDEAFDRAYLDLERSLFGSTRSYAAVAPLVGVSAGAQVDLGDGIRLRPAVSGELAAHWPEATGLLPPGFGREPERLCVLELERTMTAGAAEAPDAPGELSDAVTALRLATAGAISAGPVLFERLDWRPFGIRPLLPIAATLPQGEATRLDTVRGGVAAELRARISCSEDDPDLAEALDRWELSLFQDEPFRSEQLRESLVALLGGADGLWAAAVRAAVMLGETPQDRGDLLARLRALTSGEEVEPAAADILRRALGHVLGSGDRTELIGALDASILGLGPRPVPFKGARALAG